MESMLSGTIAPPDTADTVGAAPQARDRGAIEGVGLGNRQLP